MADRGARATGGDAGDRFCEKRIPLAGAMHLVAGLRAGLRESGVSLKDRTSRSNSGPAEGRYDRLATLLAELNSRPTALIVGTISPALAAKAISTTIPIVFAGGGDPDKRRICCQPQSPWRQRYGRELLDRHIGSKTTRATATARSRSHNDRRARSPPNTTETEAERRDLQAAAHAVGLEL